jgi:hypothetical protein
MTTAVRLWLLDKAREDLTDAEDEEGHCRRELVTIQGIFEGGCIDGIDIKRELENAGRALSAAANHRESMEKVVRDLSVGDARAVLGMEGAE